MSKEETMNELSWNHANSLTVPKIVGKQAMVESYGLRAKLSFYDGYTAAHSRITALETELAGCKKALEEKDKEIGNLTEERDNLKDWQFKAMNAIYNRDYESASRFIKSMSNDELYNTIK